MFSSKWIRGQLSLTTHLYLHFRNLHELIGARRQLTVVCAHVQACVRSWHVLCNLTSKIKN